jgi:hypothetical protein
MSGGMGAGESWGCLGKSSSSSVDVLIVFFSSCDRPYVCACASSLPLIGLVASCLGVLPAILSIFLLLPDLATDASDHASMLSVSVNDLTAGVDLYRGSLTHVLVHRQFATFNSRHSRAHSKGPEEGEVIENGEIVETHVNGNSISKPPKVPKRPCG